MKKILVIDDETHVLDIVRLILEGVGYSVVTYTDARCIYDGDFELPDLFLLDRQLRAADGLDVCRFLKSQDNTRHIPVVIFSESRYIDVVSTDACADGVLQKPFKMSELREIVSKHTRKK